MSERKVLKVPKRSNFVPDFDNNIDDMPPMGGDMGGGDMAMDGGGFGEAMPNEPVMNDSMPPMDNNANPFDTNFDAGVEANEETDPKKYIQQLTGKLAQSLRKYNQSLPQPDADTNKYVAGMIIKQATENLSPEDSKEILDKVNSGEYDDQTPPPDDGSQGEPMDAPQMGGGDDMMPQGNDMGQMPPMGNQTESYSRRQTINELVNQPGTKYNPNDQEMNGNKKPSYKAQPYSSPF